MRLSLEHLCFELNANTSMLTVTVLTCRYSVGNSVKTKLACRYLVIKYWMNQNEFSNSVLSFCKRCWTQFYHKLDDLTNNVERTEALNNKYTFACFHINPCVCVFFVVMSGGATGAGGLPGVQAGLAE